MKAPHLRKPPIHRLIVAQALMTLIAGSVLLITVDFTTALSAWLGGMICFLPNLYLAVRMFSLSGARAAKNIVKDFYKGEAGKFLLTASGFALVFAFVRPFNAMALFGAFILVQAVGWFAPMLIRIRMS